MTSGCTVCVRGFPTELPPERVVDKLTVHFQRARNGGGEIANIEFAPESPDCAMVTFEEAAVAQRVLKTDKQLLTVGGESYPLRVCPSTPGLDPDEIFLSVSMEIDYGRVPGGKETLQRLCKQYGDIVFKFRPQEMTCLAKGPFTELQAFSSELLRGFQSKQKRSSMPDERRRSAGKAGGDGSSLQGVRKTQPERKRQTPTSEVLPPRNPKENHAEPLLEDFSLVMDSDVYLYMRKFCQKELSSILLQHRVGLVDVSGGGIATLYLQAGPQGPGALAPAHLALSRLSQQLEARLRKEKISQGGLGGAEGARGLLGELQRLCPQLLCHQDEEHLSLVGDRVEVSQAKQYVQGFIAAREAAQERQKLDVPQAVGMAPIRGKSPGPVQRGPRKGSLARRPSGRAGCQLATSFNASDSGGSRPSFPRPGSPLAGLLPGNSSQAADHHPAEAGDRTPQGAPVPPAPLETKADSPATLPGGPQEARRSLGAPPGPAGPFDLSGAVGTAGPQVSDLGRPDSSMSPKPPVDKPFPVAGSRAGRLQHSSAEESLPPLLQQDSSRGGGQGAGLLVPEQRPWSSPRMAAQRGGVSREGPPTAQGAGAQARPPGHLCEWFTYSELAVEGPEDEALAELCSGLRACHGGSVVVLQERHRLGLHYPREAKQQVLETLHCFSAQRLAVLTGQLLSLDAQQQGRTREDTSRTEIQRSPPPPLQQQIGKGSAAGLLERPPRHPLGLAGESLSSSWVQRAPDAPQPTVEQNFPSDGEAWLGRELARAPAAGEGCPGQPGTEA